MTTPLVSARVLDFLEGSGAFELARCEVSCSAFFQLRSAVRRLITTLKETPDEWIHEQLLRLQRLLARWLTAPSSFQGDAAQEVLDALSDIEHLTRSWPASISQEVERAFSGVIDLSLAETALQRETGAAISRLVESSTDFRIYCHRSSVPLFTGLLAAGAADLTPDRFLHSPRQYRDSPPFEVLVKVGPLRTTGWGSAPSALLSAPRFSRLTQIIWAGTADEPQFGRDLVVGGDADFLRTAPNSTFTLPGSIRWQVSATSAGAMAAIEDEPVSDDLDLLPASQIAELEARRQSVLLLFGGKKGVLYPRNATVLVFDPLEAHRESVREAQVSEELRPGMFLIWPRVQEGQAAEMEAAFGGQHYVGWKGALRHELSRDAAGLVRRLRAAGLNLAHLEAAARHWSKEPTSVIHAPQMRRHFSILLSVLGFERRVAIAAWSEVARSRGEAIQAGVQEHSRLMQLSVATLRSISAEIEAAAQRSTEFNVLTPEHAPIFGAFFVMRIEGIEDGYRAPEGVLREIISSEEAEQWLA